MADRAACAVLRPFRGRVRLILLATFTPIFGSAGVLAAVKALHTTPTPVVLAAVGALVVFGLVMSLAVFRAQRLQRRYYDAYARADIETVRALQRMMHGEHEPRNAFERANRALAAAELLLHFERWPEARDAYAAVDVAAMPAEKRPGIRSAHALATAHAGDPVAALAMLESALREADAVRGYAEAKRWYVRARHGMILSLAGRHEEAFEVLDAVLTVEEPGELPHWTAACFFIARSLQALGRIDDAQDALRSATTGDGPFVARAQAALELSSRSPLRDGGAPLLLEEPEDAGVVRERLRRALPDR
jgi:tetratricopeptide (TPR) repeat protein